jgi:hypothetical protein
MWARVTKSRGLDGALPEEEIAVEIIDEQVCCPSVYDDDMQSSRVR